MKIIVSPSKTMKMTKNEYLKDKELIFPKKHKQVLDRLKSLTKPELSKALSIKTKLLDQAYEYIKTYNTQESYHAFPSYTGMVFYNLNKESFKEEEYMYIETNICILDALYGILEAGTLIKQYRLDMKAKIGLNLYKHWTIDKYFTNELVINLASTEFSKMLHIKMINIHFLQNKDGKFINQPTYSKMGRGKFLSYMIINKVDTIKQLILFKDDCYKYNKSLSNDLNITFTR